MPNQNYLKGRRKEYAVMRKAKEAGWLPLRTAGSHGFVDVIAIDFENKIIRFIQCKPPSISRLQILRLENQWSKLNDWFQCEFKVE